MKSKFIFILPVIFFLAGCQDDDPGPLILTVNVSQNYSLNANAEMWMYLTNEKDELLGIKPFANGSIIAFNTSKSTAKLTLTVFRHNEDSGDHAYDFTSYVGVQQNGTISLANLSFSTSSNPPAGNFDLAITDYHESEYPQFALSVSGTKMSTNPFYDVWNFSAWTISAFVTINADPSDLLITGYRSGEPVYYFNEAVSSGDDLQISFSDFLNQPETIDMPPTVSDGYILGIRNNTNYIQSSTNQLDYTFNGDSYPKKLGYVPGFEKYYTRISGQHQNHLYDFTKRGTPPLAFEAPEHTIQLFNSEIGNLDFATTLSYDQVLGSWVTTADHERSYFQVYARSDDDVRIISIPSQLTKKFPFIDLDKYTMNALILKKNLLGTGIEYFPEQLPDEFELLELFMYP